MSVSATTISDAPDGTEPMVTLDTTRSIPAGWRVIGSREFTEHLLSVRFIDPEQTNPPGIASTSTPKLGEARSFFGSSAGTTGRSLTTLSSPFCWTRRARTTRPSSRTSAPGSTRHSRSNGPRTPTPLSRSPRSCWSRRTRMRP